MPTVRIATVVVAGLTLLLLLSGAAPAAASSRASQSSGFCAQFTDCAACACSTSDYDIGSSCDTGCAWLPGRGTCVSLDDANQYSNPIEQLFGSPQLPEGDDPVSYTSNSYSWRLQQLQDGNVNCPVRTADGTVPVVTIMLQLAGFMVLYSLVTHCNRKRQAKRNQDTAWLRSLVTAHTPAGDRLQWQGVSRVRQPIGGCGTSTFAVICFLLLGLPSLIWLAVGLPTNLDSNWEFGFYFGTMFPGGFGILFSILALACYHCDRAKVSGYAVTDKRALVVVADAQTRTLGKSGSVVSHNLGHISTIRMVGESISFFSAGAGTESTLGPAAAPGSHEAQLQAREAARQSRQGVSPTTNGVTTITFTGVQDAAALFTLLQARADGNAVPGVLIGAPAAAGARSGLTVATPVKSEDPTALSSPSLFTPLASGSGYQTLGTARMV